jgi:hypothetical protein
MRSRSRSIVSNLKLVIRSALIAGSVGLILGLIVGYVVFGSALFTILAGVVCAVIGVWYVVWEMKPPSRS